MSNMITKTLFLFGRPYDDGTEQIRDDEGDQVDRPQYVTRRSVGIADLRSVLLEYLDLDRHFAHVLAICAFEHEVMHEKDEHN